MARFNGSCVDEGQDALGDSFAGGLGAGGRRRLFVRRERCTISGRGSGAGDGRRRAQDGDQEGDDRLLRPQLDQRPGAEQDRPVHPRARLRLPHRRHIRGDDTELPGPPGRRHPRDHGGMAAQPGDRMGQGCRCW